MPNQIATLVLSAMSVLLLLLTPNTASAQFQHAMASCQQATSSPQQAAACLQGLNSELAQIDRMARGLAQHAQMLEQQLYQLHPHSPQAQYIRQQLVHIHARLRQLSQAYQGVSQALNAAQQLLRRPDLRDPRSRDALLALARQGLDVARGPLGQEHRQFFQTADTVLRVLSTLQNMSH